MESGEKILEKLDNQEGQLELLASKLVEHDEKFDKIEARLADHDDKLDRLIVTQIEHGTLLKDLSGDVVSIKDDVRQILNAIDGLAKITKNADEDRYAVATRMDRHEEDIEKIKLQLKMA